MWETFLKDPTKKLPDRKRDRESASSRRASRIPQKSDKEELRQAYLQGAKDQTIDDMMESNGAVFCQKCEKDGPIGLEKGRSWLHQHHNDVERDEGPKYNHRTRNPGADRPRGLLYVCDPCHREVEGRK